MTDKRQKIWEKHKHFVELLAQVNNSCVFVVEFGTGYLFISESFVQIFGYSPEAPKSPFIEGDFLEARIHPDDRLVLNTIQDRILAYINTLPVGKQKDYKHIYEFRVRNNKDKYVRVISQHQVLEFNEDGSPWLMLGITDIAPDQSDIDIKARVVNFKTGEIVSLPLNPFNADINFTPREKEVLELIKTGLMSKEISDKLMISVHTVNKHRQHILEKMNADNILEAIEYAKKLSLIDF